jgi:hypothetical protein
VISGLDSTAAVNPELLVFRHRATVLDENDQPVEVEQSVLHLVWWSFDLSEDDGAAQYVGVPLAEDGLPIFDDFEPRALSDLLPYRIACSAITDAAALAHPKLFVDPASGSPHVFATDFSQCLFQMIELVWEPDPEVVSKRRRGVIIFGRSRMAVVTPVLPLASAKVEVGHDLSVVMYWDRDEKVEYIHLRKDGLWSDLKSLAIDDELTRSRAVELIRTLTH